MKRSLSTIAAIFCAWHVGACASDPPPASHDEQGEPDTTAAEDSAATVPTDEADTAPTDLVQSDSNESDSTQPDSTQPDSIQPDISCNTICSLATSAACFPFGLVGSLFCGAASLDVCSTICTKYKAGKMHCLKHGESSACMVDIKRHDQNDSTDDLVSWCDHSKDTHHTYVRFEFRKDYTPPGRPQPGFSQDLYPHINHTATAPEGHCRAFELNPLLENPPAVYRWQVCTRGEGCSAWRHPAL